MLSTCTLYQHSSEPTCFKPGVFPSLLDLVITNEEGMMSDLSYLSPLGKSDHLSLQFSFNLTSNDNLDYAKFNLNAGDYDHLRSQVHSLGNNEYCNTLSKVLFLFAQSKNFPIGVNILILGSYG